jgi:hypothetical protein
MAEQDPNDLNYSPPLGAKWWAERGYKLWQIGPWHVTFDRDDGKTWSLNLIDDEDHKTELIWEPATKVLRDNHGDLPLELYSKLVGALVSRLGRYRRQDLNPKELVLLDRLSQETLSSNGWLSGRRLRSELGIAPGASFDEFIRSLQPRFVRRWAEGSTDYYSLTLPGLLASEREEDVRRIVAGILTCLARKFSIDPDFFAFAWSDVRAFGGVSDTEKAFVSNVISVAQLGRQSGQSQWDVVDDLEFLKDCEDYSGFEAYVRRETSRRPWASAPMRFQSEGFVFGLSIDPPVNKEVSAGPTEDLSQRDSRIEEGRLGEWILEDPLGSGGQGDVFKIRHRNTNAIAVAKILRPGPRSKRWSAEASALERLKDPSIVRLLESHVDETPSYLVMEYVPGRSLAAYASEMRDVPLGIRVRWIEQLCSALGKAHRLGLFHRDVKPENILIRSDRERAIILDFGLVFPSEESRLTETAEQVGSKYFIAPECEHGPADGSDIGPWTDVYSLAKVVHFVSCGGPPYSRENHRLSKHNLSTLLDDARWESVSEVLDRATAEIPTARTRDTNVLWQELRAAFAGLIDSKPIPNLPASYVCVFCKSGRYRRVGIEHIDGSTQAQQGYGQEGQADGTGFVFLECERCGNSQRFKIKYDQEGWFRP